MKFEAEAAAEAAAAAESADAAAVPWTVVDAIAVFRMLRGKDGETPTLLDVRPRKEHDRESIKGSVSAPAAIVSGTLAEPIVSPDLDGMIAAVDASPELARASRVVVVGDGGGEGTYAREALRRLSETFGAEKIVEMRGGQDAWLKYYTPAGKPRPRYVGYGGDNEETFWTSSN